MLVIGRISIGSGRCTRHRNCRSLRKANLTVVANDNVVFGNSRLRDLLLSLGASKSPSPAGNTQATMNMATMVAGDVLFSFPRQLCEQAACTACDECPCRECPCRYIVPKVPVSRLTLRLTQLATFVPLCFRLMLRDTVRQSCLPVPPNILLVKLHLSVSC